MGAAARHALLVQDFAALQLEEIEKNIASRRNKIFLLMEEVRRLRIQLRLRGVAEEATPEEEYPSSIPFFPPINEKTIKMYTRFYAITVAGIITFGGLVAPILEVRLGIGGAAAAALRLPLWRGHVALGVRGAQGQQRRLGWLPALRQRCVCDVCGVAPEAAASQLGCRLRSDPVGVPLLPALSPIFRGVHQPASPAPDPSAPPGTSLAPSPSPSRRLLLL